MAFENIDPDLLQVVNQQRAQINNQLEFQLEVEVVIQWMEHIFRGDVLNPNTGEWMNNVQDRKMNEKGVKIMSAFLRDYLTKDVALSIIDEYDLGRLCFRAGSTLAGILFLRGEEIELKVEYYSYVFRLMMTKIEMGLRRAMNRSLGVGMTLKQVGEVGTTIEHIDRSHKSNETQQEEQKRFSFFRR